MKSSEPPDRDIWSILGRYFDQSLSQEDRRLLQQWLEESPENRETLEFLKTCRSIDEDRSGEKYFSLYTDDDWESVADQLDMEPDLPSDREQDNLAAGEPEGDQLERVPLFTERITDSGSVYRPPELHNRKRSRLQSFLKLAAMIVLVSLSAWLSLKFAYTPETEVVQQETELLRVVSTNRGERANVTLADGTTVMLNVDSRLLISPMSPDGERRVALEGEAFFDVAHDSSRPFLVESHGTVTEVLGTSFAIRSYAEDDELSVVVKSGSVALKRVSSSGRPEHEDQSGPSTPSEQDLRRVLQTGDVGLYDRRSEQITTETITHPDDLLGWTNNRLIFREATLNEIIVTLERWFDVTITTELSDPGMAERRFTLNMHKGHIRDVLELISESSGVGFELQNDDSIILR